MADPAAVNTAIQLTPIILGIVAGVFAVIKAVAIYLIDKRVKDRELAEVLENAVRNGVGIVQQAASGAVVRASPSVMLPVPDNLAPGVQYVLDHAAEAVARFGVTPQRIAEKLVSRIGLKEIETNIATTAAAGTPTVVPPLAPSGPATTADTLNRDELARHAGIGA